MDLILIPGFWLNASSWDGIVGPLDDAGHIVHALTLPGRESRDADRSGIGLRDHVDVVVAVIDSLPSPVVLVGHSGGGAVAHAAADARPDAVARVVYVDSGPLGDGGVISDEFPVVNGELPLPDWSVFEDADLVDLDDELRERFRSIAIPEPARVAALAAVHEATRARRDDRRSRRSEVAELPRLYHLAYRAVPTRTSAHEQRTDRRSGRVCMRHVLRGRKRTIVTGCGFHH